MHRGTLEQGSGTTCISTITPPVTSFSPVLDKYRYTSPCYNHHNITVIALWVATPFLSTMSVAAVCVAVSTNQWLLTQENIKNENYTGRGGDNEFFPKNTISGLWTLCYTNPGKHEFFCSNIEYFPKEEYSPDLKDSTMAIPYTVTKSAAFFMLSTFLLFVGEFCCLVGHFSRQRRFLTFISGVIFIISGLLMLIGLVMYISIFKAEVGGKLRPTSQLQPAVFTYKYGYSFILYVTGFVSAEVSGTCAVFLYIYWHQKDWRKKDYELRAKFAVLDTDGNFYPFCRKHPNNLSSDNLRCSPSNRIPDHFTPVLQRRFYLDRQSNSVSDEGYPSPICLRHSMSCSVFGDFVSDFVPKKQNRKVGTDDLKEDCLPLPSELCQHHLMSTYPYGFLSRNHCPRDASTNTESERLDWRDDMEGDEEDEEEEEEEEEDCSSAVHDHDFIPFDLGENPTPVPPISEYRDLNDCIRSEEFMYETLTKTTPV